MAINITFSNGTATTPAITTDGWFCYYKGFAYANTVTGIHSRINNKMKIDRQLTEKGTVTCLEGEVAQCQ